MLNGEWTDFITDFMSLTEGAISPALFRRWSAISLVAGALERRVWIRNGPRVTFPNLYVLLVAPPGVGKYIIEEVRELWTETREPGSRQRAFHVAPDNMTKAALIDTLAKAKQIKLMPEGPPITYHSLLIAAEEFQVLLPAFDQEFIGALNSIFNNKRKHEEARRHGPFREVIIDYPQLNILGGAQPSYFVSTFPEEAWTTGFARRIIMVYSGKGPKFDLFYEPPVVEGLKEAMLRRLGAMSQMFGEMEWSPEAANRIAKLHQKDYPPVPTHSKLAHYNRSRQMFMLKLATISTIARTGHLLIEPIDIDRANEWLHEAEATMPDVFREMVGKSDSQVIEEMHYFIQRAWAREHQKPISGGRILEFLLGRVPSDKAGMILMMAERANIIARVAGTQDLYIPRPRAEHEEVE